MTEDSFTIRAAREDDLPEILNLLADDDLGRERERTDELSSAASLRAFGEITLDPRNELLVVENAGRVAATLQLTFIPSLTHQGGERAQVEGVRVASDYRSRGVGRWLMGWVISRSRERGCRMVQLTTDKRRRDAHRFYESLGFEPTHEGMKLRLPS